MWAAWALTFACMPIGNVIYQALQDNPDWAAATERSFFQVMALLVFALLARCIEP